MSTATNDNDRKASPTSRARWWKRIIIAFAVLNVIGAAVIFLPQAKSALAIVLEWTKGMGAWGMVYLAAIYAASCVLLLPGLILTLGSGFAFGLVGGIVVTVIGSLLGVSATFFLGRTVARKWVERATSSHPKFLAIDEAVGKEGFKIVLLTRLSPLIPFNLLNYGFGVTRVSFRDYFFGSWIGMFPATVLYVYLGTAAKSLTDLVAGNMEGGAAKQVLVGVGLAAAVLVTVVITKIANRALKEAIPDKSSISETQDQKESEMRHA